MPASRRSPRLFVRFGDLPEDGRSRAWISPNIYHASTAGDQLPGISAYEVSKVGEKFEIDTKEINLSSGHASLVELLTVHALSEDLPIYLLAGEPLRWPDLDSADQDLFESHWTGDDHRELQGTDGEPLLRNPEVIGRIPVHDLICKSARFPDDFLDLVGTETPAI